MKRAAVLFSGGLDSTFVCYKLLKMGYEVHPLTYQKVVIDIGSKPKYDVEVAQKAFEFLRYHATGGCLSLKQIAWGSYEPVFAKDTHTEHFRNLNFISQATNYCVTNDVKELYIGEYDNGPAGHMDASSAFLKHMREVLTMNPFKVKLRTLKTLRIKAKWDILENLVKDNLLTAFILNVRWCYNRDETPNHFELGGFDNIWYGCGKCKSCQLFMRQLYVAKKG